MVQNGASGLCTKGTSVAPFIVVGIRRTTISSGAIQLLVQSRPCTKSLAPEPKVPFTSSLENAVLHQSLCVLCRSSLTCAKMVFPPKGSGGEFFMSAKSPHRLCWFYIERALLGREHLDGGHKRGRTMHPPSGNYLDLATQHTRAMVPRDQRARTLFKSLLPCSALSS